MNMSPLTWLADHIFDPIKAAISRAQTSSNPVAAAVGNAASDAYANISKTVGTISPATPLTGLSAAAIGNKSIADFELGIQTVVDAFITASVGRVPIVGEVLAEETVSVANVALAFGEQHGLTLLSSLFSHGKTKIAAAASVPKSGEVATGSAG